MLRERCSGLELKKAQIVQEGRGITVLCSEFQERGVESSCLKLIKFKQFFGFSSSSVYFCIRLLMGLFFA